MPTKDASQRRPALIVRKEENNNNNVIFTRLYWVFWLSRCFMLSCII